MTHCKPLARPGVTIGDYGNPPVVQDDKIIPGRSVSVAASPERLQPHSSDLSSQCNECLPVRSDGVIVEITIHDLPEPFPYIDHRLVHSNLKLGLDRCKCGSKALPNRVAPKHELSVAGLRTDVREPEEIKCLRFTLTSSPPSSLCISAEFDQPGLVRMQLQLELRKTFTHFSQEFRPRLVRRILA